MTWNHLSIPKTQWCSHCSLGISLYYAFYYLSMLGLKFILVGKMVIQIIINIGTLVQCVWFYARQINTAVSNNDTVWCNIIHIYIYIYHTNDNGRTHNPLALGIRGSNLKNVISKHMICIYLSQCWHRSMLAYGVTKPQWHNSLRPSDAIPHECSGIWTDGPLSYLFKSLIRLSTKKTSKPPIPGPLWK